VRADFGIGVLTLAEKALEHAMPGFKTHLATKVIS
jgi:hypothetical protein